MSDRSVKPRGGLYANTRDMREAMSDEDYLGLSSVFVGRQVLDEHVEDIYPTTETFYDYRARLDGHEQPSGEPADVYSGIAYAAMVTPLKFIQAVNGNDPNLSPGSRRFEYNLRRARDKIQPAIELAKKRDMEDAMEKFANLKEYLETGDYDVEDIMHLGRADSPQDFERLGEITVELRPKPILIDIEFSTDQTILGFSAQNDRTLMEGNQRIHHAFRENGLGKGLNAAGISEASPLVVPVASSDIRLSSGHDNAGPELLEPPRYIKLGPVLVTEIATF